MTPLDADIHDALDRALLGATSWSDIYTTLRKAVPDGEEERWRAFIWAFAYDLITPADVERRAREGSPFGAMMEFDDRRIPPRLADVPADDVAQWANSFEEISDPRLVSRIGDLLWSRRAQPDPHLKAHAAHHALIELSRRDAWESMEATDGLVRAIEIGLELGNDELVRDAAVRSAEAVDSELKQGDNRPGIAFTLLRALVDLRREQQPDGLSELVERAESVYGNDPHQLESALELQIVLATTDEERLALRLRQAGLWRDAARSGEGLLRASFLEKALDIARTHGLAELARDLRVELQGITEEELDLKTISTEVEIDSEELERFYSAFVKFGSWEQSLRAFGGYGPPGGESDTIERQVSQQMQDHPLQYLMRNVVLDPDLGVPLFHAEDHESHKLAAVAQSRWMSSQIWALSAVEILGRVESHYGRPTHEELTAYFTTPFIDTGIADRIARSFELWWDDRFDESAHLLVPRIEAVIRNLAREVGLPIIREPYGGKPGGVRPLGELLHGLGGRLASPGWHAYLYHLLSDPLGLNLRNVIAHGVRARIERGDAALLLHTATLLRLLRGQSEAPVGDK